MARQELVAHTLNPCSSPLASPCAQPPYLCCWQVGKYRGPWLPQGAGVDDYSGAGRHPLSDAAAPPWLLAGVNSASPRQQGAALSAAAAGVSGAISMMQQQQQYAAKSAGPLGLPGGLVPHPRTAGPVPGSPFAPVAGMAPSPAGPGAVQGVPNTQAAAATSAAGAAGNGSAGYRHAARACAPPLYTPVGAGAGGGPSPLGNGHWQDPVQQHPWSGMGSLYPYFVDGVFQEHLLNGAATVAAEGSIATAGTDEPGYLPALSRVSGQQPDAAHQQQLHGECGPQYTREAAEGVGGGDAAWPWPEERLVMNQTPQRAEQVGGGVCLSAEVLGRLHFDQVAVRSAAVHARPLTYTCCV
jgi:hypothetical protein